MPITVTDVITEAYQDAGVIAREFSTPQGYQLSDGLKWFNQLLGDTAMNSGEIPYITQQYPLQAVVGQEMYFVPGLVDVQAMVFYIGSVRYAMSFVDRAKYFGQPRANNINALPVSYTYERVFGGCNVWVYFWPQQPFLFNITGNFFMSSVSLNQDLTQAIAAANLGFVSALGTGSLSAGQLVINNVDLAGAYGVSNTAANLATTINADVPFVNAIVQGINELAITSTLAGQNITVATLGTQSTANYVNFSYFNVLGKTSLIHTYFAQGLDQFYIDFKEYQLAERICQKLNFDVPIGVANQLAKYYAQIVKMTEPLNLACQKMSTLTDAKAINYAATNIGRGYTTSGL